MQGIWQRYLQLKRLFNQPWSQQGMDELKKMTNIDPRLGSPTFQRLWKIEKRYSSPKQLLKLVLNLVDFQELTGDVAQIRRLLSCISPELAPDHPFWWDIAEQVDKAFPNNSLAKEGKLARQVHQFRYLISCHQAEYVRQHFRRGNQTDAESLASYLKNRTYNLAESARLHNKVMVRDGKTYYPDGRVSYNIKILQKFHTEFIISSSGRFLNEIDPEKMTVAGIVNGASFNYAKRNDKRHWDLDVLPVSLHDPEFRWKARKGYIAPTWVDYNRHRMLRTKQVYPYLGLVNKEVKRFSQLIKKA